MNEIGQNQFENDFFYYYSFKLTNTAIHIAVFFINFESF